MARKVRRRLMGILASTGWLMLIAGCDTVSSFVLPVDSSTVSSDVAVFLQQLAREALAALLF